MKNILWAICLFFITTTASAEINFLENPTWSTVLEKAKKENKMIFLDGFATWCGPCKSMDAETYKNQEVADFYNANFINIKYDMEKGEGKMLAERYLVTAYPNLVFIDPEGVMVHKGVGYHEAAEFVALGKAAKDPSTQYYTLKKKALELSPAGFVKFSALASSFEDEDLDELSGKYLGKQADILGNNDLIELVMTGINTLPDEKSLAYVIANKAKIIATGNYTAPEVEERMVNLALVYALSENVQKDQNEPDFAAIKTVLDKYVPEKSFFILNYFRTQYLLDNKKTDEAIAAFDEVINNVPAKLTFDQLCNAMMNVGPILAKEGKLEPLLTKFEAVKIQEKEADQAYMKDFVVAIIYIKIKDFDKFKITANKMLASKDTPESVKKDLTTALEKMK